MTSRPRKLGSHRALSGSIVAAVFLLLAALAVIRTHRPGCEVSSNPPARIQASSPDALPSPESASSHMDSAAHRPRQQVGGAAASPTPEGTLVDELDRLLNEPYEKSAALFRTTIRAWAEAHPAVAALWAQALTNGPFRTDAFEQVAIAWANSDLRAAAAWISSLPDDPARAVSARAFSYEAARDDPLDALRMVIDLPASRERDDAVTYAISQWASGDAASASSWALQVSDPQLRQRLFSAIAVGAATLSPSDAAALAALALEPGPRQADVVVSIVQRWAQSSPRAAAEWLAQFPDGPVQLAAVENLSAIWGTRDPAGLSNWIQYLSDGPVRDAALSAYAGDLGLTDPPQDPSKVATGAN